MLLLVPLPVVFFTLNLETRARTWVSYTLGPGPYHAKLPYLRYVRPPLARELDPRVALNEVQGLHVVRL